MEYWLHRYQTGLTALVAIVGLVGVSNQISATQKQTRSATRASFGSKLSALQMAQSYLSSVDEGIRRAAGLFNSGRQATHPPETIDITEEQIAFIGTHAGIVGTDPFQVRFIALNYPVYIGQVVRREATDDQNAAALRMMTRLVADAIRSVEIERAIVEDQIKASA